MINYIIRRLLQVIPVLLFASMAIFILIRLIPGDPATVLGGDDSTPEQRERIRVELGLDKPLPIQYLVWLGNVVQGDLGNSIISKQPVTHVIMQRLPATAELALGALFIAIIIGIPLGMFAALRRGSLFDLGVTAYTSTALGIPNFWLGILLIIFFVIWLGWLPPGGRIPLTEDPGAAWKFLLLPVLTLSVQSSGILIRFTRTAMLEVLPEDYIRTARAKGLSESAIVIKHALRNALVPVVTIVGLQLGRLLAGAVIAETIFAWPGVGRLVIQAVQQRDYAVVQGVLLLLVVVFVIINLITDLLYGFLDPRIRLAKSN